jgi:hypothetical protein
MSLFTGPAEHAANPPQTWTVVRKGSHNYQLRTAGGVRLDSFERKRDAEAATTSGPLVALYERERRWYAGETIPGWRPYSECCGASAPIAAPTAADGPTRELTPTTTERTDPPC